MPKRIIHETFEMLHEELVNMTLTIMREYWGMAVPDVAELTGLSTSTIYKYSSGLIPKGIRFSTVMKLCRASKTEVEFKPGSKKALVITRAAA